MSYKLHFLGFWIDVFRWTGIRNRLRCPRCNAVGTWKPHGWLFDFEDTRRVPRWLCKWCGHYVGPEGMQHAHIDIEKHEWSLTSGIYTPETIIDSSSIGGSWPWAG